MLTAKSRNWQAIHPPSICHPVSCHHFIWILLQNVLSPCLQFSFVFPQSTSIWFLPLGFPSGSVVKNLPIMQEPQEARVLSLGWEEVFLPGEFCRQRSLVGYSPRGSHRVQTWLKWLRMHSRDLKLFFFFEMLFSYCLTLQLLYECLFFFFNCKKHITRKLPSDTVSSVWYRIIKCMSIVVQQSSRIFSSLKKFIST